MNNKYICPAPWNGAQISNEGAAPCCSYVNGSIVPMDNIENLHQILYSNEFEKIRQGMLKGEYNPNCRYCYEAEENGFVSHRQSLLSKYNSERISLQILETIFDNICNLKCRGCNSGASHLWIKEEKELFKRTVAPTKHTNLRFNNYDVKSLTKVDISGGEPLLSKNAEKFLKLLIDEDVIKNIELTVVTNATVTPSTVFLECFENSESLHIAVSIDGYGELSDFYRSNSKFSDIEKNLKKYYNYFETKSNKFSLEVITTVNIYNINMLDELEEFLKDYPKIKWNLKLLEIPQYLSIMYLPKDYKEKLIPLIKHEHLVKALYASEENYFVHFINFHKHLEKRNQALPNKLLKEYIDCYKENANSDEFFDLQVRIIRGELY